MKLMLTGLKSLTLEPDQERIEIEGYRWLKVEYCAICRTDAKMWSEGHRDLDFPRVPGHEMVVVDSEQKRYVVWPGEKCGTCRYCKSDQENLCEDMKISGFHNDGGFSDYVHVKEESLIPLPEGILPHIASFAEPVGCSLHALEKVGLQKGEKIIIYGGGTIGLITAYLSKELGAIPLLIEKNEKKIDRVTPFLKSINVRCEKNTNESDFDVVINACPAPIAFSIGMTKLAKGGRFSFFSGLKKNQSMESNLINLIHYKENEVHGSYGATRKNMCDALFYLGKSPDIFKLLIEKMIPLESVSGVIETVLSGDALKYMIHFTGNQTGRESISKGTLRQEKNIAISTEDIKKIKVGTEIGSDVFDQLKPVDEKLHPAAQNKIDNKTKPLGALGTVEELAVKMSLIQKDLNPIIKRKALIVFAADHGISEEGVSAFPSEVTFQMVQNFLNGGAAINVFCRHHDIDIRIVDMGVNATFESHPDLIDKKIRKGTRNFALEPAMTEKEALSAIENGMEVFLQEYEKSPIDIIGLGEMGIANTTSSSAIISTITGISAKASTGRGTGVDDKGLDHKAEVIEKALKFHQPDSKSGLDILQKIGGFEIAGITGAILAAASKGTAIVLDGVISTAAGLIAYLISKDVSGYLISGHKSVEIAQKAALNHMGLNPVIDLNMRLGEGTGAALTIDIVDASCRIMREMASFDEAGVSNKD